MKRCFPPQGPQPGNPATGTPPVEGRRERRRAETRERLYRCALQLFAERGFFNTTVEDITEAADVGKGTFFNYFPTKEHVLGVLAEIQLRKAGEALQTALAGKEQVRDVLSRFFHRAAEEPARSRELTRSLLPVLVGSPTVRKGAAHAMAKGRQMLARIFTLGQERREVGRAREPAELANLFQQQFIGTLMLWAMQDEGKLQPRLDASIKHFWAAVTSAGGSMQ